MKHKEVFIGDIVALKGDINHSKSGSLHYYRGFSKLVVISGSEELVIDCADALIVDRPPGFSAISELLVENGALSDDSKACDPVPLLELEPESTPPRIRFFDPNPLSPHGAGYWYDFRLYRSAHGYRLFPNGFGLRNKILYKFGSAQRWRTRWTISENPRTARWFIDRHKDGSIYHEPGGNAPSISHVTNAVRDCPFFAPQRGSKLTGWVFDPPTTGNFIDVGVPRYVLRAVSTGDGAWAAHWGMQIELGDKVNNPFPEPMLNSAVVQRRDLNRVAAERLGLFGKVLYDLSCAKISSDGGQPLWTLDWNNARLDDHEGKFGLRHLWEEFAGRYVAGLESANSKNHLSFIPTAVRTDNSAWRLRFLSEGRVGGTTVLRKAGPADQATLRFVFRLAQTSDGNVPSFEASCHNTEGFWDTTMLTPRKVRDSEKAIDLLISSGTEEFGETLIGGVLLKLGSINSESTIGIAYDRPTDRGLEPGVVAVHAELVFAGDLPRPAREDPEWRFALDEPADLRDPSLVVDLGSRISAKTKIAVSENSSATASRMLEIQVKSDGTSVPQIGSDVVIIDTAPFNVVRVSADRMSPVASQGEQIAVYRDPPEAPPGWEFNTIDGKVRLGLQSQAIGEEMIKGLLSIKGNDGNSTDVPIPGELFDFRLSPPAVIDADRTDIDTARAPAPWNLRRLLDRREGTTGMAFLGARFELLYGLTTRLGSFVDPDLAQDPEFKIAEQEAFVGRVPYPSGLRNLKKGSAVYVYAKDVAAWIKGLRRRAARVPVYRDRAKRKRLLIDDKLSYTFRSTRQTANPFTPDVYAIVEKPPFGKTKADAMTSLAQVDLDRPPLRGGVDFGFESRNIYDNAVDNPDTFGNAPSQGKILGLSFGGLGGSGIQHAYFDEGRTQIVSETVDGRISNLTIVRVGRIAMLWNHARHIIVYERTTRTAPRYEDYQPSEFEGLNALRKVREYIEITEPHRLYPDSGAGLRVAGPLRGCFFETTTIPVKSSWGKDINGGWITPLRGPLGDDEKKFYPAPKAFLEFARPSEKGEGRVNQLVSSKEKLVFYTSTVVGAGGNPDQWRAHADVDYPVTEIVQPPDVPFLPAYSGSKKQPNAQSSDFGQSKFTLEVVPAGEAVDLMHGRGSKGIEARVFNISVARGLGQLSKQSAFQPIGLDFAKIEAKTQDRLRELALHTGHVAERAPGMQARTVDGLRETGLRELRTLKLDIQDIRDQFINLFDKNPELEKRFEESSGKKRWLIIQNNANRHAETFTARFLNETAESLSNDILPRITDRLRATNETGEAEAALVAAMDILETQARDRLGAVDFVPSDAVRRLDSEIERQINRLSNALKDIGSNWHMKLADVERRFKLEDPSSLEHELTESLLLGVEQLRAILNDAERSIKEGLGPLYGDLKVIGVANSVGPVGYVSDKISDLLPAFSDWMTETLIEDVPPFAVGEPDWSALRLLLDPIEVFKGEICKLSDDFEEQLLSPFSGMLDNLESEFKRNLDVIKYTIQSKKICVLEKIRELNFAWLETTGRDILGSLGADLKANIDVWATELGGQKFKAFTDVFDRSTILKNVVNPQTDLTKIFDDNIVLQVKKLEDALDIGDETLANLKETSDRLAREAVATLRNVGERIENAITDELKDEVESIGSDALEMVRTLAEGPITDTMSCTRAAVGYYYKTTEEALRVTNACALFNDLGKDTLNALSTQVPFDRIRDRLLPQLKGFDLNKMLPDFAGLKLDYLFKDIKIPEDPFAEYDWISMRHGFDKHRLMAWSEVNIDKTFRERMDVFELTPITLQIERPRFKAESRQEASKISGLTQMTKGRLSANWIVALDGEDMITIADSSLNFDSDGELEFDFRAKNLRLAPALQFVTDAIQSFLSPSDGMTITPVAPGGIKAELSLPIPDIGTGAFTMIGITLYSHFTLQVAAGFEVSTGLWLSRPERPFGIAILFLGGGGWFGVNVRYRPPTVFETRVSVGISAGAIVALNFGVARGSAGILFTLGLDFYQNSSIGKSGDLAISVGLLVWGEFSILGIASAYLRLTMRIEYRNGEMTGFGQVSVSIRICWCFTLNVNQPVQKKFSGNSSSSFATSDTLKRQAIEADLNNYDW